MRYMRSNTLALFLSTSATLLTGVPVLAADPPPIAITGGVLVNATTGMTLYTYDRDVAGSGRSNCNGDCAFMWPPMLAGDAKPSGAFTVITREGGERQWVYKGKPLYLFSGDAEPGDNNGNGVNGVWRVATP
jgi:predicted lipoprotein with Yx(FWY)xxD motif